MGGPLRDRERTRREQSERSAIKRHKRAAPDIEDVDPAIAALRAGVKEAESKKKHLEDHLRKLKREKKDIKDQWRQLQQRRRNMEKLLLQQGIDPQFFESEKDLHSSSSDEAQSISEHTDKKNKTISKQQSEDHAKQLVNAYAKPFTSLSVKSKRFTTVDEAEHLLLLHLFLKCHITTCCTEWRDKKGGRVTRRHVCQSCGGGVGSVSFNPKDGKVQVKRFVEEAMTHICTVENIKRHIIKLKYRKLPTEFLELPLYKTLSLFEKLIFGESYEFSLKDASPKALFQHMSKLTQFKVLLHIFKIKNHYIMGILPVIQRAISVHFSQSSVPPTGSQSHPPAQNDTEGSHTHIQNTNFIERCARNIIHSVLGSLDDKILTELGSIEITATEITLIKSGISNCCDLLTPKEDTASAPVRLRLRHLIARLQDFGEKYLRQCSSSSLETARAGKDNI